MLSLRRQALPLALVLALGGAGLVSGPAAAAVPTAPGPAVVLTGSGWGHSVGMSQYGARAMAQANIPAPDILTHYYSGTRVGSGVGAGDGSTVRIDLFAQRTVSDPGRVLLRAKGTAAGAPTPQALGVRVTRNGVVTDYPLPSDSTWSVGYESGEYVLRDAGGTELARTPTPMHTYSSPAGPNPALLALPQLGASTDPAVRAGTFKWGELDLVWLSEAPGRPARMQPVLRQTMREYLRGIAEMPSSWEPEALRAQAIAARTYAARQGNAVFSATPTHQAYAGWDKEGDPTFGPRWVNAVDSTSELKVIAPDGTLAATYYSSSHGLGRTENSQDSWAYSATIPYLRSVADPWSNAAGVNNPYRSWTAQATNVAFAGAVGLARVNSVRVESRTEGLSPKVLVIDGWTAAGNRVTCRWSGGRPCPDNDVTGKGAAAKLRGPTGAPGLAASTVRADGRAHAAQGMPSQQISTITLAPFTDDEQSVHQFAISALAAAGVTSGCAAGPTSYCPALPVTRGQMASFLVRARGIAPDTGPDRFIDVAGTGPHRTSINALARDGIVLGVGDGSYRPDSPVSRAQMASFLRAAFALPLSTGTDRFDDIAATGPHRASINTVAERGLTAGCTSSSYCPSGSVTREQMASFLARALGLVG